jgi:putative ABC transport system permease protein
VTFREALRIAVRALRANRLRSGLTMLGILIGVASVILLISLGNGTSEQLNKQISSLGTNLIGVFQSRGNVGANGRTAPLTDRDVQALQEAPGAPHIVSVTPVKQANALLNNQGELWRTNIMGSSADFPAAFHRTVAYGSFFTDSDVRTSARVVILGKTPLDNLFDGHASAALGQQIRIGHQTFTVSGVLAANGLNDDLVVMPISTVRHFLVGTRDKNVDQIVVQASSQDLVRPTMAKITDVMMQQHHVDDPSQKDFQVQSNLDLLKQFSQVNDVFTLFLAVIAAIALLVGGIGVMNIMLVTVTERTREIGIRKAVGARRKAILKQFLMESIVLSGLGGLLGVALGIGLTLVGAGLGTKIGNLAPPVLTVGPVLLAFLVSLAIGLFFGAYPASRAARLRPIEALRHE